MSTETDIPPRDQHPITDDSLQEAYDQSATHGPAVERYHSLLADVQHTIENHYLDELVHDARANATNECIHADDNGWAFVDYECNIWDQIFDAMDFDDPIAQSIVRNAHKIEAERLGEPTGTKVDAELLPEADLDNPDMVVAGKSEVFRTVENVIVSHLRGMVADGCTRTQAFDYWMTEEQGLSQTTWANIAGREQPSISDSVGHARLVVEGPDEPAVSDVDRELTPAEKRTIGELTDGEADLDA